MVADKLMIMNEHTKGFVDIVQWLSNLVLSHLEIKGHKYGKPNTASVFRVFCIGEV